MASGDFVEKRMTISEFKGIDQTRGIHHSDPATSPDAQNFVSRFGFLRLAGGLWQFMDALPAACERVYQAFFTGDSDGVSRIVACGGGSVYAWNPTTEAWVEIGSDFESDDWDAVNYRHEDDDWLILFNGVDVPQYWDGSAALTPMTVTQDGETVVVSQIALLYERLWGAVSATQPDRIYWSESFDPENWDLNASSPDDGGGFIEIPTFDGSKIRSILPALGDVLVLKDKSLHRVVGTYPGEFELVAVHGAEGTLAYRTAVLTADRLYFLGADGLCYYDGTVVAPIGDHKLTNVWARLNQAVIDGACAVLKDEVLYISVPLDEALTNTHVVEYSLREGTYSLIACPGIRDWLLLREGQKQTLLALVGDTLYRYDSGGDFAGDVIAAYWTSPEITLGTLSTKKQTGRVYMSVTAQSSDFERDPSMKLTLSSGDKVRSKVIPLKNGANEIRTRIKVRGRSFRFKIENMNGDLLTVNRGMEIAIEEDVD